MAAQGEHWVPSGELNVPAGQTAVHSADAEALLAVPAGHVLHASAEAMPLDALNFPGGQEAQWASLVRSAPSPKVPAGQSSQRAEFSRALKRPEGHAEQRWSPDAANSPAEHVSQAVC